MTADQDDWDSEQQVPDEDEVLEQLAKHIHYLLEGEEADCLTFGGIAWNTRYSAIHRTRMRHLARIMMTKFDIRLRAPE